MKKGVTLRLQVYIEGEDAPANDFAKTGQSFILQILDAGMKAYAGSYMLGVTKVEALEGSGDSDDSDHSDANGEPRMTFIANWTGAGHTASPTSPPHSTSAPTAPSPTSGRAPGAPAPQSPNRATPSNAPGSAGGPGAAKNAGNGSEPGDTTPG